MAGNLQDTSRLTTREREAVYRCYCEFFKDSADISASINRVSLVFQISPSIVRRILAKKDEGKPLQPGASSGRKPVLYDYTFKEILNDIIFAKIKCNEYISLDILLELANEQLDFNQSKTTLYKIIKKIGYKFKKIDRRRILINKQKNIIDRVRFCSEYLKYSEQNMKFIYLDETWIFENGRQIRQWTLENNPKGMPSVFKGEGRRYTVLNAGTKYGFLPGCDLILDSGINDRDYHKTMNGELFHKWVNEKLIPSLQLFDEKCVIIMDNAPYHSIKIDKLPTTASRKEAIQQWLREHNIPFEASLTKIQLLSLIKPFSDNPNFTKYHIDQVLKNAGHEVLRLPPYNCQYNPIELAWAFCKTYYNNQRIQGKLGDRDRVKCLWKEALQKCTADKWKACIEHAEKEVSEDWTKYMGYRNVADIPPFIINTSPDDSDSDNDFEEFGSDEEIITVMVVDSE